MSVTGVTKTVSMHIHVESRSRSAHVAHVYLMQFDFVKFILKQLCDGCTVLLSNLAPHNPKVCLITVSISTLSLTLLKTVENSWIC